MLSAIIADIQRASLHDGYGIRTTVFFKGCPLNCKWCHNPECITFKPQMMYYPDKCIGCGKCDEGCYSGAKVMCGTEMSSDELLREIMLDKDYYGIDGGVTFSGGEPFAQADFLNEIIDKCREENINCAVETSLIYYEELILKKLQLVMADLKIWDNEIHKEYTGVDNTAIKENFKKLNKLNIPIIARTPIIPGINQQVDKISQFFKTLENVKKYELLPYHPLGVAKQKALNMAIVEYKVPTKQQMEELNKYAYIC